MKLKTKSSSFILLFLASILINACTTRDLKQQNKNNNPLFYSINIEKLLSDLEFADKNLIPQFKYNSRGIPFYQYTKLPGEGELTISEIKERISLGASYFDENRENIRQILRALNTLKINNKLVKIESGALGYWIPSKNEMLIDFKVINMGTPYFLDVLRHETIHIAQSCYGGSKNSFPKRIGLPLEFSKEINVNLSHNIYAKNPEEVMNIEREAYSYSKIEGVALKLLNRFCK